MNEARAQELRLPYRAEELRREAAGRIQGLTRERRFDGFSSIVLDRDAASLIVYWKGRLPQEMGELVDELRREVAIDVRDAPYSKDELLQETHRIIELDPPGVRITGVGPKGDCSGLPVTVDQGTDLTQASREIKSWIRLEFEVRRPATLVRGECEIPRSPGRRPHVHVGGQIRGVQRITERVSLGCDLQNPRSAQRSPRPCF
jgi:hypothetical protein